jgi:hypothetical protein
MSTVEGRCWLAQRGQASKKIRTAGKMDHENS